MRIGGIMPFKNKDNKKNTIKSTIKPIIEPAPGFGLIITPILDVTMQIAITTFIMAAVGYSVLPLQQILNFYGVAIKRI